ncbi:hypothetical protein MM300_01355 [Evansella sp. LMS18]|nr:hypothetical protein [Evansella sp. LMS18]UTR11014.1 hypothetical protein MM300_01355 [Evansella sp. LMS18]
MNGFSKEAAHFCHVYFTAVVLMAAIVIYSFHYKKAPAVTGIPETAGA